MTLCQGVNQLFILNAALSRVAAVSRLGLGLAQASRRRPVSAEHCSAQTCLSFPDWLYILRSSFYDIETSCAVPASIHAASSVQQIPLQYL